MVKVRRAHWRLAWKVRLFPLSSVRLCFCVPVPIAYWSSALLLFLCDCSLGAAQAGWVPLTSITVSSPTTLYPQLFRQGWVAPGRSLPLSSRRPGLSYIWEMRVSPSHRSVDSECWRGHSNLCSRSDWVRFSFQKGRIALACSETYLYILLMCVFPFL